jgi:hypothetical protein
MAKTRATTPKAYIADLPADRRATIAAVRDLVLRNLPDGYVESVKELHHACLMGAYAVPDLAGKLEKAFRAAGKKWDMGKSCLHFRTMEDLEVDALAEVIAA